MGRIEHSLLDGDWQPNRPKTAARYRHRITKKLPVFQSGVKGASRRLRAGHCKCHHLPPGPRQLEAILVALL